MKSFKRKTIKSITHIIHGLNNNRKRNNGGMKHLFPKFCTPSAPKYWLTCKTQGSQLCFKNSAIWTCSTTDFYCLFLITVSVFTKTSRIFGHFNSFQLTSNSQSRTQICTLSWPIDRRVNCFDLVRSAVFNKSGAHWSEGRQLIKKKQCVLPIWRIVCRTFVRIQNLSTNFRFKKQGQYLFLLSIEHALFFRKERFCHRKILSQSAQSKKNKTIGRFQLSE